MHATTHTTSSSSVTMEKKSLSNADQQNKQPPVAVIALKL